MRSNNVVKLPNWIDEEFVERTMRDLDRATSDLMEAMQRPDTKEMVGKEWWQAEMASMRLATMREEFSRD